MIPFLDLKTVNAPYAEAIRTAMDRVLESGWYLLGRELEQFEAAYAAYCGASHAVGVASGLDALILILRAFDLGPGDEVLVPSNTYIATVLAVTACGAQPVFVEPDPETHLIDPALARAAITPQTRAIMPVHLYGRLCDMEAICTLAREHNLKVVEDAAQSHGARYPHSSTVTGFPARAVAHSFYPSKNLGAMADAGMVTTDDGQLADRIRALRNYGSHRRYYNKYVGHNSRMDEMQAAILRTKLPMLDTENARRRQAAAYYLEHIQNERITLPQVPEYPESHVWHLFVIRARERDRLRQYLEARGIQTQIHYPVPPHRQECYPQFNKLSLPIAERLAAQVLSLPLSPVLDTAAMQTIVEALNEWK